MPFEDTLEREVLDDRARRAQSRGRGRDFDLAQANGAVVEISLRNYGPFTLDYDIPLGDGQKDRGRGVEDSWMILVRASSSDVGVGIDRGGFTGFDSGNGIETEHAAQVFRSTDTGTGIDTQGKIANNSSDVGAGADSGALVRGSSDVGSGTDVETRLGVGSADVGTDSESESLANGFTDDFNRSGVPMGNGWTANRGSFGCDGSAAYVDSTGFGGDNVQNATQALAQNGTLQVTIAAISPVSGNTGLIFRRSDVSNYLYFGENDFTSTYSVVKVVAGTPTSLFGGSASPAPGDVLKVVLNFFGFDIYLNGGLLVSITESFNSAEINHGLFADVAVATAAKWDDFSFT